MNHPECVGNSGNRKCKGYCLGGLCHLRNTLHVFTIPQQRCGISLRHKQGYTTEVLGKKIDLLGFKTSSVDRTVFSKVNSMNLVS